MLAEIREWLIALGVALVIALVLTQVIFVNAQVPSASRETCKPLRPRVRVSTAQSALRRRIFRPAHAIGSYRWPATRSFIGMIALSVILMPSGQTSVQHLVMLQ